MTDKPHMAEAWEPPAGDSGATNRPFDRQALQATLADALRDAELSDGGDDGAPAPQAPPVAPPAAAAPPAAPPAPGPQPPVPAPPAAAAPPVPAPSGPKVNPFAPKPAPVPGPAPAGAPAPGAAPRPAPGPRTGPSILSGGISNAISQMTAPTGSLGGTSINALRPPASPLGGGGPRPLPGISGLSGGAAAKTEDEPTEEATIQLRRPSRPEPEKDSAAPAPAAPAAPVRPSVVVAAWMPSDDDILPRSTMKRKGRRGK